MFRPVTWFLFVSLMLCNFIFGCGRSHKNIIVTFLDGAERQAETLEQLLEIQKVFTDMLYLAPEQLRKQRYANYIMEQNAWTAPELLNAYFVPQTLMEIDQEVFYWDITDRHARALIRQMLNELEDSIDIERRGQINNKDKGEQLP